MQTVNNGVRPQSSVHFQNIPTMKGIVMKIDKYEATVDTKGIVHYFAVKGKSKYEMPEGYKEMYNDKYLAIEERTLTMPELYGDKMPATHYIPLYTGGKE